jgi:hypothetical protein
MRLLPYRLIPVYGKHGSFAFVDDYDYAEISKFHWTVQVASPTLRYAVRYSQIGKGHAHRHRFPISMHVQIMGRKGIDHRNNNGLDNRRNNLRFCTQSQNLMNTRRRSDNKSGVKGVCWDYSRKKWQVHIRVQGKSKSLGRFSDLNGAALAYKSAARKYFGTFARLV